MNVAVAMSGGVDSSVAAYLMKSRGHDVVGLTMDVWSCRDLAQVDPRACCGPEALRDAARVAERLAQALEDPPKIDSFCLWNLDSELAALSPRIESKDAARMVERLAQALESSQETGDFRLWRLSRALAALSARMEPKDAAKLLNL